MLGEAGDSGITVWLQPTVAAIVEATAHRATPSRNVRISECVPRGRVQ
jgi:hypothetical protein